MKPGKRRRYPSFIALSRTMLNSAEWRQLSPKAKIAYIHIKHRFNGSNNESIQGTINYESFKVFKNWKDGQVEWVEEDLNRFDRLWSNEDRNVQVYNIDEANRYQILKLRKGDRCYKVPNSIIDYSNEKLENSQ